MGSDIFARFLDPDVKFFFFFWEGSEATQPPPLLSIYFGSTTQKLQATKRNLLTSSISMLTVAEEECVQHAVSTPPSKDHLMLAMQTPPTSTAAGAKDICHTKIVQQRAHIALT